MDKWLIGATPTDDSPSITKPASQASLSAAGQYRIVQRLDGRFNIVGSTGTVNSRRTRGEAEECMHNLMMHGKAKAPPCQATRRSSRLSEAAEDVAKAAGQIAAKPKRGHGPGRGHKRKDPLLSTADEVLEFLQSHPVTAKKTQLGKLAHRCAHELKDIVKDHSELKLRYEKARTLLAAEIGQDPGPLRRSEIAELVGTGYDDLKGRTIRRHKLNVMNTIRLHAGDDICKQRELAEAVFNSLDVAKPSNAADQQCAELQSLVCDGIREMFTLLSATRASDKDEPNSGHGRYSHGAQVSMQTLRATVASQIPAGKIAAVARMLDTNRDQLKAAQSLYEDFESGKAPVPYQMEERSCNAYDPEWERIVGDLWRAGTRLSEKKKDVVRNKKDKSDKHPYRIRLLEQSIPSLCIWMNRVGKEKSGDPEFQVSMKTMIRLMPHEVRKPGRQTSLCRYHMEYEHFHESGRQWSAVATKEAPCGCKWPSNAHDMRTALNCPKQKYNGSTFEYYPIACTNRTCVDCIGNLDKLTCDKCRAVKPFISYMSWQSVPYFCNDGREIESYDFVKARLPIGEFLQCLKKNFSSFMPHHERAKWQDEDAMWLKKHIHEMGCEYYAEADRWIPDPVLGYCFYTTADFSNAYTHAPKYEHAGRFFHTITSTLYGNILYVPLDAAADEYISPSEKARLHTLFRENNEPPILMISMFGISPDAHSDTAFVQHFTEKHFYPWLSKNFPLAMRRHILRTDGCVKQFKCGRHFRWVSNHSENVNCTLGQARVARMAQKMQEDKDKAARDLYEVVHGEPAPAEEPLPPVPTTTNCCACSCKLDHSHSESCHGKDASDHECGRCKFAWEQQEMRHNKENPTQMDTSLEIYEWSIAINEETGRGNLQPQRALHEKKAVGVYERVFFFIGAKDVKHNLPECESVKDSSKMHQFFDIGRSGYLKVRKLSCHWCLECKALRPQQCLNRDFCGGLMLEQAKTKKSGLVNIPYLRSAPALRGADLATLAKVDSFIAIELDDVQIPWVIAQVLLESHSHSSGEQECWMGKVKNGDQVLYVRLFQPTRAESMIYTAREIETFVFVEDLRLILSMALLETRASCRNQNLQLKRYTLAQKDKFRIDETCVVDSLI